MNLEARVIRLEQAGAPRSAHVLRRAPGESTAAALARHTGGLVAVMPHRPETVAEWIETYGGNQP